MITYPVSALADGLTPINSAAIPGSSGSSSAHLIALGVPVVSSGYTVPVTGPTGVISPWLPANSNVKVNHLLLCSNFATNPCPGSVR